MTRLDDDQPRPKPDEIEKPALPEGNFIGKEGRVLEPVSAFEGTIYFGDAYWVRYQDKPDELALLVTPKDTVYFQQGVQDYKKLSDTKVAGIAPIDHLETEGKNPYLVIEGPTGKSLADQELDTASLIEVTRQMNACFDGAYTQQMRLALGHLFSDILDLRNIYWDPQTRKAVFLFPSQYHFSPIMAITDKLAIANFFWNRYEKSPVEQPAKDWNGEYFYPRILTEDDRDLKIARRMYRLKPIFDLYYTNSEKRVMITINRKGLWSTSTQSLNNTRGNQLLADLLDKILSGQDYSLDENVALENITPFNEGYLNEDGMVTNHVDENTPTDLSIFLSLTRNNGSHVSSQDLLNGLFWKWEPMKNGIFIRAFEQIANIKSSEALLNYLSDQHSNLGYVLSSADTPSELRLPVAFINSLTINPDLIKQHPDLVKEIFNDLTFLSARPDLATTGNRNRLAANLIRLSRMGDIAALAGFEDTVKLARLSEEENSLLGERQTALAVWEPDLIGVLRPSLKVPPDVIELPETSLPVKDRIRYHPHFDRLQALAAAVLTEMKATDVSWIESASFDDLVARAKELTPEALYKIADQRPMDFIRLMMDEEADGLSLRQISQLKNLPRPGSAGPLIYVRLIDRINNFRGRFEDDLIDVKGIVQDSLPDLFQSPPEVSPAQLLDTTLYALHQALVKAGAYLGDSIDADAAIGKITKDLARVLNEKAKQQDYEAQFIADELYVATQILEVT